MYTYIQTKDVEAVEYFLLPLSAPNKVSRFRVCFLFQLLSSKCFRFHKNLTASTVSASISLLHVLWKMLPLPAPQKVKCFRNRFRFQLLSSKCFRFHKKFTASAYTSLIQTVLLNVIIIFFLENAWLLGAKMVKSEDFYDTQHTT